MEGGSECLKGGSVCDAVEEIGRESGVVFCLLLGGIAKGEGVAAGAVCVVDGV